MKKKVVVYDLNETLYSKSSKDQFFRFICYKKGYKLIHLFQLAWLKALGSARLIGRTSFKENFYNYLQNLPPQKVERYAEEFWTMEFPEKFRQDMIADIERYHAEGLKVYIITGGFEVYIKPLEKFLPLEVIGTRTAYEDGNYRVLGEACNGEEKIRRLKDVEEEYELLEAYSDEDEEILYHAKKGYLLKDNGELELVEK